MKKIYFPTNFVAYFFTLIIALLVFSLPVHGEEQLPLKKKLKPGETTTTEVTEAVTETGATEAEAETEATSATENTATETKPEASTENTATETKSAASTEEEEEEEPDCQ